MTRIVSARQSNPPISRPLLAQRSRRKTGRDYSRLRHGSRACECRHAERTYARLTHMAQEYGVTSMGGFNDRSEERGASVNRPRRRGHRLRLGQGCSVVVDESCRELFQRESASARSRPGADGKPDHSLDLRGLRYTVSNERTRYRAVSQGVNQLNRPWIQLTQRGDGLPFLARSQ